MLLVVAVWMPACGGGGEASPAPTPTPTPKAWQGAVLVETNDAGSASDPQIALDASGNAMAVWGQYDGTRDNIWVNRYNASTAAWGTAGLVEKKDEGLAYGPQVVRDALGNVTAAWTSGLGLGLDLMVAPEFSDVESTCGAAPSRLQLGGTARGDVFPANQGSSGSAVLPRLARPALLGGGCGSRPRWIKIFSTTGHSRMAATILASLEAAGRECRRMAENTTCPKHSNAALRPSHTYRPDLNPTPRERMLVAPQLDGRPSWTAQEIPFITSLGTRERLLGRRHPSS